MRLACALILLPCLMSAADVRIGDAGAPQAGADLSKYYPQTSRWQTAGVTAGLPAASSRTTAATITPEDDIQATINATAAGVIELAAGTYTLSVPLRLKSGIILRGTGPDTILSYTTSAITATDLTGAGIEGLTLRFADPDGLAAKRCGPSAWLNVPGWTPVDDATISWQNCNDCHIDGVTIDGPLSHPLQVINSKRCTIRGLTITRPINRGPGAGNIEFRGSSELLVAGLRATGLRQIRLVGPLSNAAFVSCSLGAGFYFRRGDEVNTILVEDCHFLLPPGYPYKPFSKGPMPLGPDSLVINCSAYNHGTDAVVGGVLMEEGIAYVLQPRFRGTYDPITLGYRSSKLVYKHQMQVETPEKKLGKNAGATIAPTWDEPPAGMRQVTLSNNILLHDFLTTGAVDRAITKAPIADLLATPLTAGSTPTIAGVATQVAELPADCKREPGEPDPRHVQVMQAKFGVIIRKADGASINLLGAMDKNWKAGAIWQAVTKIGADAVLIPNFKKVGAKVDVYIGDTELKEGSSYVLQPGWHPITVRVAMVRKPPFLKKASLSMQLALEQAKAGDTMFIDTPKPDGGSLYPFQATVDELAGDRAAIAAWFEYFYKFRKPDFPTMRTDIDALVAAHPGTTAAAVAESVQAVLAGAPFDETSGELTFDQYSLLRDYYQRAGTPERFWCLGKAKRGGKAIIYYPKEEVR